MGQTPQPGSLVERLDALYEYEREPIKEKDLHGWKIFWATFAGEHIAGTEFVIGPLFVMHGCTARDVLLGLLIGNFLAVLSWAFICAPIAVKTRLTQYWQLAQAGRAVADGGLQRGVRRHPLRAGRRNGARIHDVHRVAV